MNSFLEWALAVVGSGGIGAAITYISTYKSRKLIEKEKAKQEHLNTEDKHGVMERDRFEAMYKQITEMAEDYNELSDEFRAYRKESSEQERKFIRKAQERYSRLAELKAEIKQLEKYSCYNIECPNRIKDNPAVNPNK